MIFLNLRALVMEEITLCFMDNVSNSFRKMGINLDAPSQRVNLPMLTNI